MIFNQDSLSFIYYETLEINQGNTTTSNCGRHFDALSFRFDADTVISAKNKNVALKSNYITYIPANFDYTRISKSDFGIVVHFQSLNYHARELEFFCPDNPEKYKELFIKLLETDKSKLPGYKHDCAALLCSIFAELYRDSHIEWTGNPLIEQGAAYLAQNFSDPDVSIDTAAKLSNVSSVYFRKLFKDNFGISPKRFILTKRIEYAADLISSGLYTLNEIADKCGFNDYKYFLVTFKKFMHVTPKNYHYNFNKR